MNINSDLALRAVINSASLNWVESPLPGITRRMLERDGGEIARRATTIVRYEAGSSFTEHTHSLGEEFIVLDGVFSDESGDYKTGMYVRNPPASRHRPFTREGCQIFVKLGQCSFADSHFVRIDTRTAAWLPTELDGQWVMPLYRRDGGDPEYVALVKWLPDVHIKQHDHQNGEEIFVLEGSFGDEFGRYPQGTWLRNPAGSSHQPYSVDGCVLYTWLKFTEPKLTEPKQIVSLNCAIPNSRGIINELITL